LNFFFLLNAFPAIRDASWFLHVASRRNIFFDEGKAIQVTPGLQANIDQWTPMLPEDEQTYFYVFFPLRSKAMKPVTGKA
jgi:hypothetical protein